MQRFSVAAEVELLPAQATQFADPQHVPVGEEDHGGITMTVAPAHGAGLRRGKRRWCRWIASSYTYETVRQVLR